MVNVISLMPIMAQTTKLSRLKILVILWQRNSTINTTHGKRNIVMISITMKSINLTGLINKKQYA